MPDLDRWVGRVDSARLASVVEQGEPTAERHVASLRKHLDEIG
jgi:hypothetical protein